LIAPGPIAAKLSRHGDQVPSLKPLASVSIQRDNTTCDAVGNGNLSCRGDTEHRCQRRSSCSYQLYKSEDFFALNAM